MIFPGPLSEAQKFQSQRNYNLFSLLNGFSYTCEGETFLILLATRLDCPDALISALGAMMFFGYLFLPLSKVISARIGGARCQAFCWIARNVAALMMAGTLSVPASPRSGRKSGISGLRDWLPVPPSISVSGSLPHSRSPVP